MAFSKALVQPFRKNTLLIGAGWRAYFAPYNIALGSGVASTAIGPQILDLQTAGPFNTNAPPSGWTDCGWIKDFKMTPGSKIGKVRSGYRGAVRAQYRGEVGESFEFKFREAARMQFKISTGTIPFNLLSGSTPTTIGPLSASGAPKTQVIAYNSATPSVTVASISGAATSVVVGSYIVVDQDYVPGTFGIVGAAGVPLQPTQTTDIDYIRKTSDFVARVTAINGNVFTLDQPFVGGGSGTVLPAPTAPVITGSQPFLEIISGWAAREGATYVTEWSGLFIMDTIDAAQIAIYYPHVSISQFKDIAGWTLENAGTTDETGYELDTMMEALAFDDPLDGETVVGYRAFYARPGQAIAI
jgi:hypothetical protein